MWLNVTIKYYVGSGSDGVWPKSLLGTGGAPKMDEFSEKF